MRRRLLLLFWWIPQSVLNAQLVINTVAGGYSPNNIPATSASIPINNIAVGPSGSLYVATCCISGASVVYKIASNGLLTIYAGTGSAAPPIDNVAATQSPLSNVLSLAVDLNENLYIYDYSSYVQSRIVRVSPTSGLVNTVLSAAQLIPRTGTVSEDLIASDGQGHLLIGRQAEVDVYDPASGNLRRVAGTGAVGFYQGEGGQATQALLGGLLFPTADAVGNVFIADPGNFRIYRVDAKTGIITTVAGNGTTPLSCSPDGKAGNSISIPQLFHVSATGSGDAIFYDASCYSVRKIDHVTGLVSTVVGTGSPGFSPDGTVATAAKISARGPVVVDIRTGDLYLADNNRVRKVSATNNQITTVGGTGDSSYSGDGKPAPQAQLNFPQRVAVDGTGNIYIADTGNNRIRRVDGKTGLIATVVGNGGGGFNGDGAALSVSLSGPSGIALDQNGNLLIADTGNNRIRKVVNGVVTTIAGNGQSAPTFGGPVGDGGPAINANVVQPHGLAVDTSGGILFADFYDNRVRRIAPDQTISTVAGIGSLGYSGDGSSAINAQLSFPTDVAIDRRGNLLVADTGNDCVRQVIAGIISTFAGSCAPSNVGYVGDGGPANRAVFDSPNGLVSDTAGNTFISASGHILKVGPDGIITTFAGTTLANCCSSAAYPGDGGPAALAYLAPYGLALDNNGGLLVADGGTYRIRRIAVASQPTFTAASVTNGASFVAGLVAGSIGTLFGTNLTTMLGIGTAGQLPLPLQLAGTSVQVNGSNVPLFGVANVNGQNQVNFQIPWELAGQQNATVAVTNYGASSQPLTVPLFTAQPGLFTDATGNSAALHGSTNLPITPSSPATKGEIIAIFATGLGPVSSHPQNGMASSGSQLTTIQPTVTVGGLNAQVQYSGLAPGLVGGYQLNVTVPTSAPSGTVSVVVTMNGVQSNSAKLPVQ